MRVIAMPVMLPRVQQAIDDMDRPIQCCDVSKLDGLVVDKDLSRDRTGFVRSGQRNLNLLDVNMDIMVTEKGGEGRIVIFHAFGVWNS